MSAVYNSSNGSARSFLTALGINGALLLVEVAAFALLKNRLIRIYAPRTYLPPPAKRATDLPTGPWKWLPAIIISPAEDIIRKNGLDAYMSIRFFQMMMKICGFFLLVTWPILLPINSVNLPGENKDGLAQLAFGNIPNTNTSRYWAHLVVAWILTLFVLWLIRRELDIFIHNRHQFLISRQHSKLAQAKTVLITNLPKELANDPEELAQLFSFVPGGVAKVWIYKNTAELPQMFEDRLDACKKLETATTDLMQVAIKASRKTNPEASHGPSFPLTVHANKADKELAAQDVEKIGAAAFVDTITRPTHRLGWIPFVGTKVDTIDWCTKEIARLNTEIEAARAQLDKAESHGSAFVQCNLQMGAHVLAQCVAYHEPLYMAQKWTEVAPDDIIWANIDDGAYEVKLRYVLSWAAMIGLIIVWAIPVAFAGAVSNVDTLCDQIHWLEWVCETPNIVQGIIQGVVPPLILAILFLILPFILQGLAWFECIPRHSFISVNVYKRYYIFLVIHGFLIVTIASGLTAAFGSASQTVINDTLEAFNSPSAVVERLAKYLPDANIFFLTYMLQQGFTGAAGALLQVGPLILFFFKKIFFGDTPRQAYEATFLMPSFDFGVMLPRMSLLATICIAYAPIAPIINGLALAAFALFWLSWKFLFTWVLDQKDALETGGLYFPLLVNNLFTGLYIQHLCMIGLFFLSQNAQDKPAAYPQAILMIILMVITVLTHIFFNKTYDPVTKNLPMSLATHKLAEKFKKERQGGNGDDFDLFSRDRIRSVVKKRLKLRSGAKSIRRKKEEKEKETAKELKQENHGQHALPSNAELLGGNLRGDIDATLKDSFIAKNSSKTSYKPRKSNESDRSYKEKDKDKKGGLVGNILAAAQGKDSLAFDAAAPAQKPMKDKDGDGIPDTDSDTDDDLDEHAFDHPSTWQDQPWIWIPKWDAHPKLSEQLVEDIRAAGVEASDLGAFVNEYGVISVRRAPPDEEWAGGHDV